MKKTAKHKLEYTPKQSLSSLKKVKTKWDLNRLYYASPEDPQIEKDIKIAEKAYERFAKKWSRVDFTKDATILKKALTDYEKLSGLPELSKPGRYFGFRKCLNVNDHKADQKLALLSSRLRKASDQILFFNLKLGKTPAKKQKLYLAESKLAHFHYFLEQVFRGAKYNLSEPEEKIIRLKAKQASGNWYEMTEKIISNRAVKWNGKDIKLPEALEKIDLETSANKIKLWNLIITEMEQIGEVAEHEMNAIITDVREEDELRGYEKPYSATTLSYEDDEKSVENLVHAVSTRGFELSKKFYKLKARYQKVTKLHYTQKYESIGGELEIPWEEAVEICRDVFYGVKKEYGQIFDRMLQSGQIDVFPQAGKRGGAFMSNTTGLPTHVFLNHVANFKSLETLSHEMGHAIHAERSKILSPLYDDFSTTTAETASTLFENLVFDAILEQASEKDKIILLHDRITRDIATVERQIAFFNVELEMHQTIQQKGAMQNSELADCMYRHLKSYLGPGVSVEKRDGYSYAYIPHLRYGFYVYTYAFGHLMSTIMAKRYQEDKAYVQEIDKFLSAGGSASVSDIFRSVGIDTTKEDTFVKALDNHADDIEEFAQLVKRKR